jgi:hypothetical protein
LGARAKLSLGIGRTIEREFDGRHPIDSIERGAHPDLAAFRTVV